MRLIGAAERALELICERVQARVAFGKPLAEQGVIGEWIADSRIEIDQARLLTLQAAETMDHGGNKAARAQIAMIKVVAPNMALRVIDRAIQAFGGAGVSADPGLAHLRANARTLRLADGPDEVKPRHGRQTRTSQVPSGERERSHRTQLRCAMNIQPQYTDNEILALDTAGRPVSRLRRADWLWILRLFCVTFLQRQFS